MIPSMSGIRGSRFTISLKSGETRQTRDICTRTLNTQNRDIHGTIIDAVRFDYACPGWQWRRAHVLFLRALMREAKVPHRFIKQVTVPRLNDADKGVVFNTHTTSGPLILFIHTLIRDMYECPRRYWTAYGLWRSGKSALDAYNLSGFYTPVVKRNGGLDWDPLDAMISQSMAHPRFIVTPYTAPSLGKLEVYKETGKLIKCSGNYNITAHMKQQRPTKAKKKSLPDASVLKKYSHLFV